MKPYKIEMMTQLSGPDKNWNPGKILDVPGQCSVEEAEGLVSGGYAKKYIPPKEKSKSESKDQQDADTQSAKDAKDLKDAEHQADREAALDRKKRQEQIDLEEEALDEQEAGIVTRTESIEEESAKLDQLESELETRKQTLADTQKAIEAEEEVEDDTPAEGPTSETETSANESPFVFDAVELKKDNNRAELNLIAKKLGCEGYEEADTKADVVALIMAKAPEKTQ